MAASRVFSNNLEAVDSRGVGGTESGIILIRYSASLVLYSTTVPNVQLYFFAL